jgi:hypothetical protein
MKNAGHSQSSLAEKYSVVPEKIRHSPYSPAQTPLVALGVRYRRDGESLSSGRKRGDPQEVPLARIQALVEQWRKKYD